MEAIQTYISLMGHLQKIVKTKEHLKTLIHLYLQQQNGKTHFNMVLVSVGGDALQVTRVT